MRSAIKFLIGLLVLADASTVLAGPTYTYSDPPFVCPIQGYCANKARAVQVKVYAVGMPAGSHVYDIRNQQDTYYGQVSFNGDNGGAVVWDTGPVSDTTTLRLVSGGVAAITLVFNATVKAGGSCGADTCGDTTTMQQTAQMVPPPPPSATASFAGKVTVPPHSKSHNVGLKINGAVVGTGTSTQINATNSSEATYGTSQSVKSGDTYEWTVDGFGQGAAVITLSNSGSAEFPAWNAGPFVMDASVPGGDAPTPTPARSATPSPTATGTPFAAATPQPNGSPPNPGVISQPGPNGQPAINSGAVTVMNPQDIYKPITDAIGKLPNPQDIYDKTRLAVEDAGAQGPQPGPSATSTAGANFSSRGQLDNIDGKVLEGVQKVEQIQTVATTKIQALKASFSTLPQTLGTVTTLPFGFNLFNGIALGKANSGMHFNFSETVDLTPYMSGINIVRQVLLWILTIAFGFLTVRAFAWEK